MSVTNKWAQQFSTMSCPPPKISNASTIDCVFFFVWGQDHSGPQGTTKQQKAKPTSCSKDLWFRSYHPLPLMYWLTCKTWYCTPFKEAHRIRRGSYCTVYSWASNTIISTQATWCGRYGQPTPTCMWRTTCWHTLGPQLCTASVRAPDSFFMQIWLPIG